MSHVGAIAGECVKTIGLIGGMSWESSAHYYRIINTAARARLGGVRSARSLMLSVDFGEIERLQHDGDWAALEAMMVEAARQLERGGADLLLICTNTMHRVADEVAASVAIPLLHIADPTGEAARSAGHRRVGLLGTAFTMEQAFYRARSAPSGTITSSPSAGASGSKMLSEAPTRVPPNSDLIFAISRS